MTDTEPAFDRIIKNFDELAVTPARTALLSIVEAGLEAIQTPRVVECAVILEGDVLTVAGTAYDLTMYEDVYVIGVGKCAVDAATALEEILGDRIAAGAVLDVREAEQPLAHIQTLVGTHPFPSAQNITHTRKLLDIAERAGDHDLVLVVISGGGSALLTQPKTHTAHDEAKLIEHLFKGGATIEDLNTVRKHLSEARGGHLAAAAFPATVVSLLFSDVPGNDIHTISSGPTVMDESTLADARAVLEKYHAERCGFDPKHLFETPKVESMFTHVRNKLVLTNETALTAMQARAKDVGYAAMIRDTDIRGEAREVGKLMADELHAARPRTVLLYGGETTVTIEGPGKGGRNEELSLGALAHLTEHELVLSVASDGRDNTEYAGGIADAETKRLASNESLDPANFLYTNDSFTFFHTLKQGVNTGYTGANVADLMVAMKHENRA